MKLVESILTKNPCYTAGRTIKVKGLMLHSVGCSQPSATTFIKNWNSPSFDRACVHGFIDGNDGTVYQTLPWNHRGWHCGSSINGSANNTHIGVEMCEPACITYTSGTTLKCSDIKTAKAVVKRTYEAAVELFAMLCKKYGLNPLADGVIISHKEGHSRGIASNHGDPEHLWSQLGTGYTMDTFRKAVKKQMKNSSQNASGTKDNADTKVKKDSDSVLTTFPNVPFEVKVLVSDLNYRSLPSMKGKVNGQTGKGVFTIVEVKDGWGRLKSGAGWIWLENPSYCTVQGTVAEQKETSKIKSVDEIAKEVIRGDWGNGAERKEKLTAAGYDYAIIQKKVNELLG